MKSLKSMSNRPLAKFIVTFVIIMSILPLFACGTEIDTDKPSSDIQTLVDEKSSAQENNASADSNIITETVTEANLLSSTPELRITFFDAGKADCFLLQTANSTTLIDCGTNKFGKALVTYLSDLGIKHIDNIYITHFDKDHVGGADKVLESFDVDTVYEPDYTSSSKQYNQYLEALDASTATLKTLTENQSFSLDSVSYDINVADNPILYSDDENDLSLVISVKCGDVSFLFAGDAENDRLAELLDAGIGHHDVLKVPHHGRAEKLSPQFFEAVSPQYAIITSSDDELEEDEVVSSLESLNVEIYLTRKGTITCTTDGTTLSFHQ